MMKWMNTITINLKMMNQQWLQEQEVIHLAIITQRKTKFDSLFFAFSFHFYIYFSRKSRPIKKDRLIIWMVQPSKNSISSIFEIQKARLLRSNPFDPSDESTPKTNRMLTRHQLVVQQTSPNKKRKLNSNSFDDELS